MKPLADSPSKRAARVRGVLADIDDTLTTHGRLHAVAYAALERLREAGLLVIPVTGRPAGWCDHIARMWPVDAVVGENGAFWFRHDAAAGRLVKRYVIGRGGARAPARSAWTPSRRASWPRCPAAASPRTSPTARPTSPSTSARTCRALGREAVARIVAIMESEGLTAKVSSIHVNGWFGGYDKLSTSRLALAEDFGVDLEREKERFVFAGDSPNDQPMFAFFPNAVGRGERARDGGPDEDPAALRDAVGGIGGIRRARRRAPRRPLISPARRGACRSRPGSRGGCRGGRAWRACRRSPRRASPRGRRASGRRWWRRSCVACGSRLMWLRRIAAASGPSSPSSAVSTNTRS